MKPAYAYLTDDDREYVIATQKHLAQLMQRHGVSVDDLSFETGIPTTSIRRWLNVRHSGFMPLPAAYRAPAPPRQIAAHLPAPPPSPGRHRDRPADGHG